MFFQIIFKLLNCLPVRLNIITFLDRIDRDQIYMTMLVFDQLCKSLGLFQVVIYPFYKTVFKGKSSSCFFKLIMAGFQYIL